MVIKKNNSEIPFLKKIESPGSNFAEKEFNLVIDWHGKESEQGEASFPVEAK